VTLAFDGCDLLGQLAIPSVGTASIAACFLFFGITLIEPLHVVGKLLIGLPDKLRQGVFNSEWFLMWPASIR
jgi:hypothetical protein